MNDDEPVKIGAMQQEFLLEWDFDVCPGKLWK